MGKSRLVYEFVHSHHTQGWRVLESASVSYGKATPYFPVIDLLKRYCHVEERDDHAHHPRQGDRAGADAGRDPPGHGPGAARRSWTPCQRTARSCTLDPPQRRQRTLDGPQARAAARKPGAAAAAGLRGSALDRYRDPGPARQPGREPADRPAPAAGQLPARVPARLGQQDLLHATAAGPAAARECRRVLAGPAGGRPQPGSRSRSC